MPPRFMPGSNPLSALGQQWLELFQQAGTLGREELERAALFYDARRLRSLWLSDLAAAMDRYMRSTPFLHLMQFNLRALTKAGHQSFPPG